MENNSKHTEYLKTPITAYGIYLAIVVTLGVIGLLCLLKLDGIPIAKLLLHYYLK